MTIGGDKEAEVGMRLKATGNLLGGKERGVTLDEKDWWVVGKDWWCR